MQLSKVHMFQPIVSDYLIIRNQVYCVLLFVQLTKLATLVVIHS